MDENTHQRRLTEREVAVVLRRAAEIDEVAEGDPSSTGLAVDELREIAAEVGIRPDAIDKALVELASGRAVERGSLLGAPTTQSTIRSVPGQLGEHQLRSLVEVADSVVSGTGVVSEALGSVRWTAHGRFLNTQIALSPSDDGTVIRVREQFPSRVRRVVNLLPGAWGGILGIAGASALGVVGLPAGAIAAASVAVGVGIGRLTWGLLSRQSHHRVQRLAGVLEQEALQHPE